METLNRQREQINSNRQDLQDTGNEIKNKSLAAESDETLDAINQDATLWVNQVTAHNTAVQHFNEDAAHLSDLIQSEAQQARDVAETIAAAEALASARETLNNKLESINEAPDFCTAQEIALSQFVTLVGQQVADQNEYPQKVQVLTAEREALNGAYEGLLKQLDHLSVDIAKESDNETLNTQGQRLDSLISDLNEVIQKIRAHNTAGRSLARIIAKEQALVVEQNEQDEEFHAARGALQSRHTKLSTVDFPEPSYDESFDTLSDLVEPGSQKTQAIEEQMSDFSAQEEALSSAGAAMEAQKPRLGMIAFCSMGGGI